MKRRTLISCLLILCLIWSERVSGEREGRFKIDSIEFNGNRSFSAKRLKRIMVSRPTGFFTPSYYYPEALAEDIKSLELFYHNKGYLEGRVENYSVKADSSRRRVEIDIEIFEGEMTRVEGLTIFGDDRVSEEDIRAAVGFKRGDAFTRKNVKDAELSILQLYANRGHLRAKVKPGVKINEDDHKSFVDFIVTEGPVYTVGEITIEGREKTSPQVILRELLFERGDTVSHSVLLKSQRNLYLTGLFKSVFVRPIVSTQNVDSTISDVSIEIEENRSVELNTYLGYGSVEMFRFRAEIINNNLGGSARKIGLGSFLSFVGHGADASFSEPRTLGSRFKTDINILYSFREESAYDIEKLGGNLVVGRTFAELATVSLRYRYENSEISDLKLRLKKEKLERDIRSLVINFTYDSRDDLFNPGIGLFIELRGELAGSFVGGDSDFWKLRWETRYFSPLTSNSIIASSLELGWTDYFGDSERVPLNELFYAGGSSDLRGFEYQAVGPVDENFNPLGGGFKFILNPVEIRQTIYKMMGGVFFIDIGNVWERVELFSLSDLRYCAGIGLRINTPIGILRCDYGFNMDRRDHEPSGRFHFNVGQAF